MGGEPVEKPTRVGEEPVCPVEPRPEGAAPLSAVEPRSEEAPPEVPAEAERRPPEPRRMGWRDWALLFVIFLVGMLSARACRGG